MEHDKEFLDIAKGMVSNDNSVREENLERMKNYIKTEVTDKEVFEFIFLKIWKSMFYLFWNSDKAKTQKAQAEKIANFFDYIDDSEVEKYHVWIKCFLLEFIKKWTKIDFLRLDKYIMLLQTIIRKYFDFNLKKNKYIDAVRIFDYIVLAIKSGFYNFNFVSNVLNNIGYIIDEFFKNESFKNSPDHEFLGLFTDKLISLFLTIRDKREISNFKENLFNRIDSIMIKDPFYRDSELKKLYQRKIFEKATSKEEVPEPQRTLLFKVYKKVKYLDENYEEKEKEKLKTYDVDPVNDYILKKSYSNRTRMTKIEKMRLLANKRRFQESNRKQLAQMEKEKMAKLTNEINKEFSQKENQKETENKHNLSLNSDTNLNGKKNENKNKNKENIKEDNKEDKLSVTSKELNNISKKNDNNSINQKKKQKLNETADLPNNDTFCSEKELKNTINSDTKKEEILSENIIKLDSDSDENKKEKKSDKAKAKSKKESIKAAVAAPTKNKKKLQKGSDSEDMELEEDLDYEEEENSNQNESAEADENPDLSGGDENAEESEENAEESEEDSFDYDEELEYNDGEDGEEFEFEEEGLMDNEDEMDFLDDEEGELDSQEEAYYESLYGKSLSSIYSKIKNKNGNKEKVKGAEPKTHEEIEMQKSLIVARNNSIKNAMLKTSSNNNFLLGKKRNKGLLNGSDNAADCNKNQNSKAAGNGSENNRNGNNNNNGKKNNGNAGPKKKVNFTLSKNTFNSYEQLKPITLTSNKRVISTNGSPAKGALKKKSKLN